ncbi:hypothetical protein IAU60_004062 [Kwoniella sp. DSM 27419]
MEKVPPQLLVLLFEATPPFCRAHYSAHKEQDVMSSRTTGVQRTIYPGESPAESSHRPSFGTAPRVNQVDADDLDSALVAMLSEKLSRSLDNLKSILSITVKPELELVIKLLLFRYGVWDASIRSSPGAKLQNLKLVSDRSKSISRRTLLLYLLLHPPVFPTYLITRIRQYALSKQWPDLPNHDWRKKAWKVLGRIENAARAWELAGWGWFLYDGRYPSLLMRLLGLRLVPSQPHLARLVSYEFMNRQLVWGAFTEFAMFAVPLLPPIPAYLKPSSILSPLGHLFSQHTPIDYDSLAALPLTPRDGGRDVKQHAGPYAHLPKTTCPICHIRYSSAPVPLDSGSAQGAALTLPPIDGGAAAEFGHDQDQEESQIFVPAQTDCEGGCQWCYYCIGEELHKYQQRTKGHRMSTGSKDQGGEGADKVFSWSCLRCGGGVTRAWRVGVEAA